MANKLLTIGGAAMLAIGAYATSGGAPSSSSTGEVSGTGMGDPERCRTLMRGFIGETRAADARNARHNPDSLWLDTGWAMVKISRVEAAMRRNGCPDLIDETTGRSAPFRIGLPGEKPRPGVFVLPSGR